MLDIKAKKPVHVDRVLDGKRDGGTRARRSGNGASRKASKHRQFEKKLHNSVLRREVKLTLSRYEE